MSLTGRQIRQARALLGLSRKQMAAMVKLISRGTIIRAEKVDGEPQLTMPQAAAIRAFIESAGVEFAAEIEGGRTCDCGPSIGNQPIVARTDSLVSDMPKPRPLDIVSGSTLTLPSARPPGRNSSGLGSGAGLLRRPIQPLAAPSAPE